MAIFEYSNSHTVKEAAEAFNISPRTVQYIKKLFILQFLTKAIKLLKGISLLKSQQSNSALNHIKVSQILYKNFLRRNQNQQIRLSILVKQSRNLSCSLNKLFLIKALEKTLIIYKKEIINSAFCK